MKEIDYEKLGTRIKKMRMEMGLTQTEVASALKVTPGYICNVENNRTAMSLRILTYYAKLMHVSLDLLVGLIDSEYQSSALDNELLRLLAKMPNDEKEKLLRTLQIWLEEPGEDA